MYHAAEGEGKGRGGLLDLVFGLGPERLRWAAITGPRSAGLPEWLTIRCLETPGVS
jgi:hypothetical protein